MPRGLAPDVDRDVMAAVDQLPDPFARTGLIVLRAIRIRIGELLDLELDCMVDFPRHSTWLKVPLDKLGTERMVPLDPEPLAALDAWIGQRGQQRAPASSPGRDGQSTSCSSNEAAGSAATASARDFTRPSLPPESPDPAAAQPGSRPHQLRHTFGTTLVNAGMNLPALCHPTHRMETLATLKTVTI